MCLRPPTNDAKGSGVKVVVNCDNPLNQDGTILGWLENLDEL